MILSVLDSILANMLEPHPEEKSVTVCRRNGKLKNTREDYFYLTTFVPYKRIIGEDIDTDITKYTFVSENRFPGKTGLPMLDYTSKYGDILCDINDEKVIPKKGITNIVAVGIYNKKYCYFCLKDGAFHVLYKQEIITVPFDKVYWSDGPVSDKDKAQKFTRLDSYYCEDTEELANLSLHISKVNIKYRKLLRKEIEKTVLINSNFEDGNLVDNIVIRCTDGCFTFRPHLMKVIPTKSMFNKTGFSQSEITLDYATEDVKSLFRIYMAPVFPTSHQLINSELLVVYHGLSQYLGMEFHEKYFSEILQHISFVKAIIPNDCSVDEYKSLLTGLDLESSYKELCNKVTSVNFYTAISDLGLSKRYLMESMRYNPSIHLMEFLEK